MCDRIQIDNTTCANVCVCRALVEGEECPALAQLSKHVPISCLSAPSVKKELSVSYLGFFLTAPHTIISHRPLRGSTWERPSRPLFRPDKCLHGDGQTCLEVLWEKDGESLCFSSSSRSTCVAQFWDDEIVLKPWCHLLKWHQGLRTISSSSCPNLCQWKKKLSLISYRYSFGLVVFFRGWPSFLKMQFIHSSVGHTQG